MEDFMFDPKRMTFEIKQKKDGKCRLIVRCDNSKVFDKVYQNRLSAGSAWFKFGS